MISPDNNSGAEKNGVRKNPPRVAFTLVEMIVTLAVACILMIAVVAFLVNGVISSTKTTAINDTTTKGRYVFEHMSKEMARSADLNVVSPTPQGNFFGPNPAYAYPPTPTPGNPGLGYQGFNYRIPVGGQAINPASIPVTYGVSPGISLTLSAAAAPDFLVPQPGDYIDFPGLNLPYGGVQIASVTSPSSSDGSGTWTIFLSAPLYSLSGTSASAADLPALMVETIQRQRSYAIQTDPSTNDVELWWYPNTSAETPQVALPATVVVAKNLPQIGGVNQYPFYAQPKVPLGSGVGQGGDGSVYVGVSLALTIPTGYAAGGAETINVQAGQSSFYSNNSVNAVFANKSGTSFALVYLSDADTDAVADTHPFANAVAFAHSVAHTVADTDTLADGYADTVADKHADSVADPYAFTCPDPDAVAHAHPVADPVADSDAFADAVTHTYAFAHADAHAFAHAVTDTHPFAHAVANPDAHAVTHAYAFTDAVAHADAHSVAHPHAYADAFADPHAFAHSVTDADTDAFADPYAFAHAFADAYANPYAFAHTVAHAFAHADPDTFANTVAHAHAFADTFAHAHAFTDAVAYPDADTDAVAHAHTVAPAG